jgi:hypothetical protein
MVAFNLYFFADLAIYAVVPEQIRGVVNAHDIVDGNNFQFRDIHDHFEGSSPDPAKSVNGNPFGFHYCGSIFLSDNLNFIQTVQMRRLAILCQSETGVDVTASRQPSAWATASCACRPIIGALSDHG